jgi:hypothetical protein
MVAGCGGGDKKHAVACQGKPDFTHYVLYRARALPSAAVGPASFDATVKQICERARRAGAAVSVQRVGKGQIRVGGAGRPSGSLAAPGRLAFYDWEPNLLPPSQAQPAPSLLQAVRLASKQRPRAEAVDRPLGDRGNDTAGAKYYVFRPGVVSDVNGYYSSRAGVPRGGLVVAVPRGVVVLKDEPRGAGGGPPGYWVLEDDAELTGRDIKDAKQSFDPQANEPIVTFAFTGRGRNSFASLTKREAERGARVRPRAGAAPQDSFQTFAIVLDGKLVSRATIDHRVFPHGIRGDSGAQINGLGDIQGTQELARNLDTGPLTLDLVPIRTR